MKYTLGTASKATGKSKSTISRDIKSGKISAIHGDNGAYEIDPAELHRVYPAISRNSTWNTSREQYGTGETGNEIKAMEAEVNGLHEQIVLLKSERDDLRRRLDQEAEERRRLTMLLTHQQPQESYQPEQQPVKSLLFEKLFGKR